MYSSGLSSNSSTSTSLISMFGTMIFSQMEAKVLASSNNDLYCWRSATEAKNWMAFDVSMSYLTWKKIFMKWDSLVKETSVRRKHIILDLKQTNSITVGIWITNIWKMNFYLSGIKMVVRYLDHHSNTGLVFKRWYEYRTKFIPLFRWHLNAGPFSDQTTFDHLNTRLVGYSDPNCICKMGQLSQSLNFKTSIYAEER